MHGSVFYCVSNMPAAVPHTSTFALTNATFPYLLELANKGLERACDGNPALRETWLACAREKTSANARKADLPQI